MEKMFKVVSQCIRNDRGRLIFSAMDRKTELERTYE